MKHTLTIAASALALSTSIGFAAGSGSSSEPKPTETTQQCEKGFVFDKKEAACVEIKDSKLNDDAIYENARELAYDGQFDNALELLARAENPRDPRILTYQGFAHRKSGHFSKGMDYYQQALSIDPNFILARSYMGQGFVKAGNVKAAEEQLMLIASAAGTDNWPYEALERAINGEDTDY